MKKVIFVASSGGHLTEILRLKELFKDYNYLLVTEKTDVTEKMVNDYNMDFLVYGPSTNKIDYIIRILKNIFLSIKIIMKFKPQTIISTGAQVGGIMCLFGKIFGCKIIYIESLARVKELSSTGNRVYKFADKFYVQWESLTKKYKKAEYLGRLI